jgi:hypothetical protein
VRQRPDGCVLLRSVCSGVLLRGERGTRGVHDVSCGRDMRRRTWSERVPDPVSGWVLLPREHIDDGVPCWKIQQLAKRDERRNLPGVHCGPRLVLPRREYDDVRRPVSVRVLLRRGRLGQGSQVVRFRRTPELGVRDAERFRVERCGLRRWQL